MSQCHQHCLSWSIHDYRGLIKIPTAEMKALVLGQEAGGYGYTIQILLELKPLMGTLLCQY